MSPVSSMASAAPAAWVPSGATVIAGSRALYRWSSSSALGTTITRQSVGVLGMAQAALALATAAASRWR
ncbi:hypothetical protein [Streptomyces sp. NPDC004270]